MCRDEVKLLIDELSFKINLSARSFACLSTHRDLICTVQPYSSLRGADGTAP